MTSPMLCHQYDDRPGDHIFIVMETSNQQRSALYRYSYQNGRWCHAKDACAWSQFEDDVAPDLPMCVPAKSRPSYLVNDRLMAPIMDMTLTSVGTWFNPQRRVTSTVSYLVTISPVHQWLPDDYKQPSNPTSGAIILPPVFLSCAIK
jgi:hypothetical protein